MSDPDLVEPPATIADTIEGRLVVMDGLPVRIVDRLPDPGLRDRVLDWTVGDL